MLLFYRLVFLELLWVVEEDVILLVVVAILVDLVVLALFVQELVESAVVPAEVVIHPAAVPVQARVGLVWVAAVQEFWVPYPSIVVISLASLAYSSYLVAYPLYQV